MIRRKQSCGDWEQNVPRRGNSKPKGPAVRTGTWERRSKTAQVAREPVGEPEEVTRSGEQRPDGRCGGRPVRRPRCGVWRAGHSGRHLKPGAQ